MNKCPNCGAMIKDKKCEYCGGIFSAQDDNKAFFGVHYFMVKKVKMGLLYLFTCGLFYI